MGAAGKRILDVAHDLQTLGWPCYIDLCTVNVCLELALLLIFPDFSGKSLQATYFAAIKPSTSINHVGFSPAKFVCCNPE